MAYRRGSTLLIATLLCACELNIGGSDGGADALYNATLDGGATRGDVGGALDRGLSPDAPRLSDAGPRPIDAAPPMEEQGPMRGITEAHNAVRRATGAGMQPLAWSPEIAAYAQAWAEEVASNRGCQLQHRPRDGGAWDQRYGENAFMSWGSSDAQRVVDSWASEISDYDYATNSCSAVCGHYTQIVWADSRSLGCGRAVCPGGEELWFCNYDPPGNYVGQRPY